MACFCLRYCFGEVSGMGFFWAWCLLVVYSAFLFFVIFWDLGLLGSGSLVVLSFCGSFCLLLRSLMGCWWYVRFLAFFVF